MKNLMTFYMLNPVINTVTVIGILIIIGLLFKFRKLEVMALVSSKWAELQNDLVGRQKLDFALNWLVKQDFYTKSILKLVPKKWIKGLINFVFNKNKKIIEA